MRRHGEIATLTITQRYFDLIETGKKETEYRRDCPYYRGIYEKNPRWLVLHVRRPEYLVCRLRKIRYISRPPELEKSVFVTTPRCYAFELGDVWGPLSRKELETFWALDRGVRR